MMNKSGISSGLALVIVAIIIVLGLVGLRGYNYLGSSGFCNRCHYMNTPHASWERSTHADVGCIGCHAEAGALGELKSHIEGARYLKVYMTGKLTSPVIKAEAGNPARLNACLECHPSDEIIWGERRLFPSERVHTNHEREGLQCTECHASLVHGTLNAVSSIKPPAELCEECHQRENVLLPFSSTGKISSM